MGATKSLLSYNHYIPDTSIEGPTGTDTDEASIPTEEPNTSTLKRKAGTKPCVTKSPPEEHIKSSPEEDIPARKKPRLQGSFPAIVAGAETLNASPDAGVAVASADAGGRDPVAASPMQPNGGASRAPPRFWSPEEDEKLTAAVKTTYKKKHGAIYGVWVAVAALVPGRTNAQCLTRWHNILRPITDEATARVGLWTTDEDSTLKDAVEKHNGKDWAAISALVAGRTKQQCRTRWHNILRPKRDEATARVGKWTTDEDSTLKDAVEKHNGKNWAAIAALVPGRTRKQCVNRWHDKLRPKTEKTTARLGTWEKYEDITLKDAVEKHNGKNWAASAAFVPGRTKQQCVYRALRSKTYDRPRLWVNGQQTKTSR
jgi:hypothetical protein